MKYSNLINIPDDGKVTELSEICDIKMGNSPPGESYMDYESEENVGLLQGASDFTSDEPSPRMFTSEPSKIAREGDILLFIRATIGNIYYCDDEYCIGRGVAAISNTSDTIKNEYLQVYLEYVKQSGYYERVSSGTTFNSISSKDIKRIPVYVPSLKKQKEIVSLLSDVDEYISNTEERIELLKKKKRGMYNLLYSNNNEYAGLFKDDTGERIAPASWSRFDIPEDWDLCNLGETCNILSGNAFSSDKFNKDNNGMQLIKRATVNQTESEPTYTTESVDEKYIMCNGDVLVSMDGNFEVRIWDEGKAALNQRVCRISPEVDYISNKYLGYVLQPIIKHCEYSTGGTTVSSLSVKKLKKINIPYPPLKTQKEISGIFRNIDKSIRCAEQDMEKMEKLKTGLLQQIFR